MNIPSETTTSLTDWPELHRQRRAIVVVDVVESVRLMQANEADVIDRWRRFVNEVRTKVLPAHGGRLVKSLGDGLLLEFESVQSAVRATNDLHRTIAPFNAGREVAATLYLRIGVHVAEVVIDELDIYGSGVNLAARIASLAGAGQTVLTEPVRDAMVAGLDGDTVDLGECYVKNLEQPVRAFRLALPAGADESTKPLQEVARPLVPTLIVLPVACDADLAENRLVGELLTDSLVETLSLSSEMSLISRLSSAALGGRGSVPSAFLSDIGADFALSGVCRVRGGRYEVAFELVETRHASVVWSAIRHDELAALLRPACELVRQASADVSAALLRTRTVLGVSQPLPTLQGHAIQAGAISLMHRSSRQDFDRVGGMLEHLIERHSRSAAPRAWLAKWYVLRVTRGLVEDPAGDARRALDHTRRAIDADPACALALAMEGFVHCHLLHDLGRAAERLDAAVSVGPNEPMAWLLRGVVHAFSDEGEAAVRCTERALRLSPIDPLQYYLESLSAAAAVAAGHHDRAIELAKRSIARNALHASTFRTLAIAQTLCGDGAAARATVRRMLALDPGFSIERFMARVPSGSASISVRFAQALAEAGVPARAGQSGMEQISIKEQRT